MRLGQCCQSAWISCRVLLLSGRFRAQDNQATTCARQGFVLSECPAHVVYPEG